MSHQNSATNPTPAAPITEVKAKNAKKRRSLTDAEVAECADQLIAAAESGSFPSKLIPAAQWADKLCVTLAVLDRVFIRSKLAKQDYDLDYGTNNTRAKTCYINNRTMLMIGKSFFESFNTDLPDNEKFHPFQKYTVAHEGSKIILTRIS